MPIHFEESGLPISNTSAPALFCLHGSAADCNRRPLSMLTFFPCVFFFAIRCIPSLYFVLVYLFLAPFPITWISLLYLLDIIAVALTISPALKRARQFPARMINQLLGKNFDVYFYQDHILMQPDVSNISARRETYQDIRWFIRYSDRLLIHYSGLNLVCCRLPEDLRERRQFLRFLRSVTKHRTQRILPPYFIPFKKALPSLAGLDGFPMFRITPRPVEPSTACFHMKLPKAVNGFFYIYIDPFWIFAASFAGLLAFSLYSAPITLLFTFNIICLISLVPMVLSLRFAIFKIFSDHTRIIIFTEDSISFSILQNASLSIRYSDIKLCHISKKYWYLVFNNSSSFVRIKSSAIARHELYALMQWLKKCNVTVQDKLSSNV